MNDQHDDITTPNLCEQAEQLRRLMEQRGMVCGTGRDTRQDVVSVKQQLTDEGEELLRRLSL